MLQALLDFFVLCRKNGLRISPTETIDAASAIQLVGLEQREVLRATLQASVVKRHADQALFDELFQLYFFPSLVSKNLGPEGLGAFLRQRGASEAEIEVVWAELAHAAARLEPLLAMGLGLRSARFEALIKLSGRQVDLERMTNPLQIGYVSQQLIEALRFRETEQDLLILEGQLAKKFGSDRARQIAQWAAWALDRMRQDIRRSVAQNFNQRNLGNRQRLQRDMLAEKPFSAMNPAEMARLRHEVDRLAGRLKDVFSRRNKTTRRGRLDIRKTLHRARKTVGLPMQLVYQRKRRHKPELLLLCDISDSVRHASRFLLQFAFVLRQRILRVRCFVFVSDIGEATDTFRRMDLHRAIDAIHAGQVVSVYANSNYGLAFSCFAQRFSEAVTRRTSVIIVGDGRNNYNPVELWALQTIASRAKRLWWLNPEPPMSWGFGDSAMRQYAPLCDRIKVVYNLESLTGAVDSLLGELAEPFAYRP